MLNDVATHQFYLACYVLPFLNPRFILCPVGVLIPRGTSVSRTPYWILLQVIIESAALLDFIQLNQSTVLTHKNKQTKQFQVFSVSVYNNDWLKSYLFIKWIIVYSEKYMLFLCSCDFHHDTSDFMCSQLILSHEFHYSTRYINANIAEAVWETVRPCGP
jgi:hypothetical protein